MTQKEYDDMYAIVGAAMEVHKVLGRGLEEAIYQEALEIELRERGIEPHRETLLNVEYKGRVLTKYYKADFYPENIVVELKATSAIDDAHRAQLINYLRITKSRVGLLINFGEEHLHTERYVYSPLRNRYVLLTETNKKFHLDMGQDENL